MQLAAQGPGVAPAHAMAKHVNEILPLSSATLIVDMGCGPGQITAAILQGYSAQLPAAARIIGADNNPQMLSQYAARRQKSWTAGTGTGRVWRQLRQTYTTAPGSPTNLSPTCLRALSFS